MDASTNQLKESQIQGNSLTTSSVYQLNNATNVQQKDEKDKLDWQLYQNGSKITTYQNGIYYQGTNMEYQMLYSNQIFSSGKHYMKFSLEQMQDGYRDFLFLGIIKDGHDYWQTSADNNIGKSNGCYACLFNHQYFYEDFNLFLSQNQMRMNNKGLLQYAKDMKNLIKQGDIITCILDIDNETFDIISPSTQKYSAFPTEFSLKGSQWKFAICMHYSCHGIKLISTKP